MVLGYQNISSDHGLADLFQLLQWRHGRRIVQADRAPVSVYCFIGHTGGCGDEIQPIFPFQALLHDLHMQKSQKATAKPQSQRSRLLRLHEQGCIIEPQAIQSLAQRPHSITLNRKQAGKNPRLHGLEAR